MLRLILLLYVFFTATVSARVVSVEDVDDFTFSAFGERWGFYYIKDNFSSYSDIFFGPFGEIRSESLNTPTIFMIIICLGTGLSIIPAFIILWYLKRKKLNEAPEK